MKKVVSFLLAVVSASVMLSLSNNHADAQLVPTGAPIGTVMAFAGEFNPANLQRLRQARWLPCDGASLRARNSSGQPTEFAALFGVIGETYGDGREEPPTPGGVSPKTGDFNLPDMRGRFLRGVDGGIGRDPDASTRLPMRQGGRAGDSVGSIQLDATRMPNTAFNIPNSGGHSHNLDLEITASRNPGAPNQQTNTVANPILPGGTQKVIGGGAHGHPVEGGDRETRPKNINVNWIVKFR